MATIAKLSNEYLYLREQGKINVLEDSFVLILLDDSFAFSPQNHFVLANIASYELPTGNGYTRQTKEAENVILHRDAVENKVWITIDDPIWTASGGDIGPLKAMAMIDVSVQDSPIIGCVEFTVPYTVPDTASFQVRDVQNITTAIISQ